MENVIPKYTRPIPSKSDPISYASFWDDAVDAFDEKKYVETVINVLSYMNPDIFDGVDTSGGEFEITKMQGSAEIYIKVTKTTFSVKAPFLKITNETNEVALLRKIAEVNFTPLRLAQIRLKDKELWFEYETSLTLCQPNKIYNVLRNIAIYADDYDDLFIDKYKAAFYKTPKVTPLTDSEKEIVWNQINTIFEEYKNYETFFEDKRWDDWVWDLIVISLLKISNMPYVNGKLRSDLIKNISMLFDGDINYKHRLDKGKNYMHGLIAQSQEEIMKNVYHADAFISLRWRSSPEKITDRLNNYLEKVKEYEKDGSNFNVSYYLQFILLKLIYDYNLDEKYKDAIETVLEEVSGLEPTESAPKLIKTFYALQTGSINKEDATKKKKGFFSNLFN